MKIELLREWEDDHLMCCEVAIDNTRIELWWCGWAGLAAAKYANTSVEAKADLLEILRHQVEANKDNDPEWTAERETLQLAARQILEEESLPTQCPRCGGKPGGPGCGKVIHGTMDAAFEQARQLIAKEEK